MIETETIQTETAAPVKLEMTPEEKLRFFSKVNKDSPNGCWIWTGSKDTSGYGSFYFNKGPRSTHRLSFQMHFRLLLPGECVLHRCDTPACVNPEHFWIGSVLENNQDRSKKGRSARLLGDAHPLRKNPTRAARGEKCGGSKLTDQIVTEIKRLTAEGKMKQKEIARLFSVSRGTILNVTKGNYWKHVATPTLPNPLESPETLLARHLSLGE